MFGFFKAKPPQSYHWNVSAGKMVACASTPCKLHPSDVICATPQEAEEAHRRMEKAREEAAAREDDVAIVGMTSERNQMLTRLWEKHRNDYVTSYKTMFIGNQRYALSSNGICEKCPWCDGTGTLALTNGQKQVCVECRGLKYNTSYSGSPAEMVLSQPVNDNEDRRFHDFVKTNPDAFNDFITHALKSGSYLGDEAEKQVYHPWYNKNPKEMMANRPQEALHLMASLSKQYADARKEWDELVKADKESFRARTADDDIAEMDIDARCVWAQNQRNVFVTGTIIDKRDFVNKKTQRPEAAYTIYDPEQHAIAVFFSGPRDAKKGDTQYIQGDVWKIESDKNGRVQHVLGRFHYI